MSTSSSYCICDFSHHALFQVLVLHVAVFPPNPLLICVYLYKEKYVCSSFDCQTIYWINNLSNQSQWRSAKASRPAWNSTDRARGTARMLLRWPSMSMAAAQLSWIFYLRSPSPHTYTPPLPHTVTAMSSSVQQRGNLIKHFFLFSWQEIGFSSPAMSIWLFKAHVRVKR